MNLNDFTARVQKVLQENNLRMTRARLAVLKAMGKHFARFLTSEEIFRQIQRSQKHSCDSVSVYRILNTFHQLNIVLKSDFHGEASRFRLNPDVSEKSSHQHFFRCLECDDISPLKGCFVMGKIREMEAQGYKHISHHLEINGTCPSCATA